MDPQAWTALTIGAMILLGTFTAWGKYLARNTATVQQRHFQLWAVGTSVLQAPEVAKFCAARLAEGMGATLDEVAFSQVTGSSLNPGIKPMQATVITVPERCASRVSFTAAGCGLMAAPWHSPVDAGAKLTTTDVSQQPMGTATDPATDAVANPLPGWFLGLNTTGRPVYLYPVPGATVLVTGDDAAVDATIAGITWPDNAVRVTDVRSWEDAWDPAVMRVVIAPTVHPGVATDALASKFVTATVNVSSVPGQLSTLSAGEYVVHFSTTNMASYFSPTHPSHRSAPQKPVRHS